MIMLRARNRKGQTAGRRRAPMGRPGARAGNGASGAARAATGSGSIMTASHPLTDVHENNRLFAYENSVKESFDGIIAALKKISALQHEADFVNKAQRIAMSQLGFELPAILLEDAWVDQLDMRSLFAWSLFETYRRFSDCLLYTSDAADDSVYV